MSATDAQNNKGMSPTFVSLSIKAYKTFTVGFITLWILAAMIFAALDFVDEWGHLSSFLSLSLLTYLICRLIAVFQSNGQGSSIASFVTTAHSRSRRWALVVFLFACGWGFEIICKMFVMLIMTLLSSAMMTRHYFDKIEAQMIEKGQEIPPDLLLKDAKASEDLEKAMAKISELHDLMGYDPVVLFGWMSPELLVFCVVMAWISFVTLGCYVTRLWWKSLKRVCMLPTVADIPLKQYVA